MTREQKELLYKITCLHSDRFYLAMEDHWSEQAYKQDEIMSRDLDVLEKKYKETYGALPDWEGIIDNVWATRDKLKKELKENE